MHIWKVNFSSKRSKKWKKGGLVIRHSQNGVKKCRRLVIQSINIKKKSRENGFSRQNGVRKLGIPSSVKSTNFYKELSTEEQQKYFYIKEKKFIPHIDTFYYSVFLKGEQFENTSSEIMDLLDDLEEYKELCNSANEDIYVNNELLFRKRTFSIYKYCIGIEGYYDIFFANSLPNTNTPRIVIQLRSIGLWTVGETEMIKKSFKDLKTFLSKYNVEIDRTLENRIDYCYHTNSIQSEEKFYSDDILKNNLDTTFDIYNKVGRKEKRTLTVEYLSLGSRSSNNTFFRSYNKVREVIEENYKEFFLEFWFNVNLISYYDFYVYSYCYKKKSYSQIEYGMIDFYCKYGKNEYLKEKFKSFLNGSVETNRKYLSKLIKGILPKPNIIINIEFQTMRKFYKSGDNLLEQLPFFTETDENALVRLFQIIDNRKIFLDYLTSKTVSFKRDIDSKEVDEKNLYMDFWYRLRKTKLFSIEEMPFIREYSRNINKDLIVSRIKTSLATLSLYGGSDNTDINEDMSYLINILNDNDFVNCADGTIKIIDNDYIQKKNKKKKALNSILKNTNSSPSPKS